MLHLRGLTLPRTPIFCGVLRYALRVRATLASPCVCVCRPLPCRAANPTLLPVVSDYLMLGKTVIYTVCVSVSNYTNVRRCAFKGRRECAAVSIVVHRSRTGLPYRIKTVCSAFIALLAWRAAVTYAISHPPFPVFLLMPCGQLLLMVAPCVSGGWSPTDTPRTGD